MFALSNTIVPRTRSSNVVSPAGTLNRIARGTPDDSRAAISLRRRDAHVRSYIHPPPAASAASRFSRIVSVVQ